MRQQHFHPPANHPISGLARDNLIFSILKRLKEDKQKVGAPDRIDDWEAGWSDNLERFKRSGSLADIVPRFVRHGHPVRWQQDFYAPDDPDYELRFIEWLQKDVIAPWFKECHTIHEFGAGTGLNLVALSDVYPDKLLYGADYSEHSVDLVNAISEKTYRHMHGKLFDMRRPDATYPLRSGDGVLTFGAIEQLAGDFRAFIEFVLSRKPRVVVHVEPVIELYDEQHFVDWLAIQFHQQRGYTEGLLPFLSEDPRIKVLEVRRSYVGSLMMEGYTRIIWQPSGATSAAA